MAITRTSSASRESGLRVRARACAVCVWARGRCQRFSHARLSLNRTWCPELALATATWSCLIVFRIFVRGGAPLQARAPLVLSSCETYLMTHQRVGLVTLCGATSTDSSITPTSAHTRRKKKFTATRALCPRAPVTRTGPLSICALFLCASHTLVPCTVCHRRPKLGVHSWCWHTEYL